MSPPRRSRRARSGDGGLPSWCTRRRLAIGSDRSRRPGASLAELAPPRAHGQLYILLCADAPEPARNDVEAGEVALSSPSQSSASISPWQALQAAQAVPISGRVSSRRLALVRPLPPHRRAHHHPLGSCRAYPGPRYHCHPDAVCVHGAQLPWGELMAKGIPVPVTGQLTTEEAAEVAGR